MKPPYEPSGLSRKAIKALLDRFRELGASSAFIPRNTWREAKRYGFDLTNVQPID